MSALGDPVLCSYDTKDLNHKALSFYVFHEILQKNIPPVQPEMISIEVNPLWINEVLKFQILEYIA